MKKMICTKRQEEIGTPNYYLLAKQLSFFIIKQYLNTTFALRATKCSLRELTSDQLTRILTHGRDGLIYRANTSTS